MKEQLNARLQRGYNFEFSKYISDGFRFTNENIGLQIAFGLLAFLTLVAAGLVPVLGSLAVNLFVSDCLLIGFALGVTHYLRTGMGDFGSYWTGFRFAGQIILFRLLLILPGLLVVGLLFLTPAQGLIREYIDSVQTQQTPDQDTMVFFFMQAIFWIFLASLVFGFLLTPMVFVPFFIVFYKLNAWDAIVYSYRFVTRKWLATFGLVILAGLIGVAGFIMLVIGALYTFPAMRNILFACFMGLTGFDPRLDNKEIPDNSDLLDTAL